MTPRQHFYVTFGQQYPRETHPTFGAAHRDGWFEIEADNYEEARRVAIGWLGRAWSGIYPEDDFDATLYPLGRLHLVAGEQP